MLFDRLLVKPRPKNETAVMAFMLDDDKRLLDENQKIVYILVLCTSYYCVHLFLQVAQAMSDEINRLGVLVNQFNHPFHTHPGFLRTFKRVRFSCVVRLMVDYYYRNTSTQQPLAHLLFVGYFSAIILLKNLTILFRFWSLLLSGQVLEDNSRVK